MTTTEHVSWRRLAVLPILVLVAGVAVLNAAGWLIDSSSLDQGDDSWGYAFGAFFLSLYALPVLVVAAGTALVGWLSAERRVAWAVAWVGAVVSVVAAVGLGAVAVASFPGTAAEVAFGVVCVATGLALVVPAALCARQTARQRTSA
jgi:hypothetical protein